VRIVRDAQARPDASADVAEQVREIVAGVRRGGDAAVREYIERFDPAEVGPEELRVDAKELDASVGVLQPEVLAGLRTAIANVRELAKAQLSAPVTLDGPQGQHVEVVDLPVERVGVYAPGGRAAYPSTVVMCAATARAAGVSQVAVCAPAGPRGRAHPVILAACVLCGVTEVYRMGGAQAIAALAYGTESVPPVDVIVGPGNAYVQEAKRQVVGQVGIDGIAGPSELVVLAAEDADPELIAFDVLAQAEHGPDSFVAVISDSASLLDAVERAVDALLPGRPSVTDAPLRLARVDDLRRGLAAAEALAPEHLELVGVEAEALADRVRNAGCLYVGAAGATAFGDYVAGTNHVLPTGGAARFQSALSASTFRRRMARVDFPGDSAARLAPAGAAIARAEGFPVHAESMERRA
jgi:histidinol dehydrogenase